MVIPWFIQPIPYWWTFRLFPVFCYYPPFCKAHHLLWCSDYHPSAFVHTCETVGLSTRFKLLGQREYYKHVSILVLSHCPPGMLLQFTATITLFGNMDFSLKCALSIKKGNLLSICHYVLQSATKWIYQTLNIIKSPLQLLLKLVSVMFFLTFLSWLNVYLISTPQLAILRVFSGCTQSIWQVCSLTGESVLWVLSK